MPDRRCAKPDCNGTLPEGKGSHCPQCGGTEFSSAARPTRRRGLIIGGVVVAALILAIVIGVASSGRSMREGPDDAELTSAMTLACKMTNSSTRDEALTDVVRRAIKKQNLEFACKAGRQMINGSQRDAAMREVVDAAISANQIDVATRAADTMIISSNRDTALKRILQRSTNSGS